MYNISVGTKCFPCDRTNENWLVVRALMINVKLEFSEYFTSGNKNHF